MKQQVMELTAEVVALKTQLQEFEAKIPALVTAGVIAALHDPEALQQLSAIGE